MNFETCQDPIINDDAEFTLHRQNCESRERIRSKLTDAERLPFNQKEYDEYMKNKEKNNE